MRCGGSHRLRRKTLNPSLKPGVTSPPALTRSLVDVCDPCGSLLQVHCSAVAYEAGFGPATRQPTLKAHCSRTPTIPDFQD